MSSQVPFDDARTLLTNSGVIAPALIQWPNEPFREPVGDPPSLWLSVECTGRALDPIEVGGEVWQEVGTVFVHVIAPKNTGTDNARALAKSVASAYRNLGPRPVIYQSASIGNGALDEEQGIWWVLTVAIDWKYQDATVPGP